MKGESWKLGNACHWSRRLSNPCHRMASKPEKMVPSWNEFIDYRRGNSRTTPQSWFRCHVRQTHAGQPVRPRSILGGTRPSARLDVDNRTRANRWHPGGDHPRFQRNRPTEKVGKFSPPFLTTRAIAAPWRPRARLQTNFSTRANAWRLWLFPNGGER